MEVLVRIHGDDHRAKDRNRDGEIPVTFGGASGQTRPAASWFRPWILCSTC